MSTCLKMISVLICKITHQSHKKSNDIIYCLLSSRTSTGQSIYFCKFPSIYQVSYTICESWDSTEDAYPPLWTTYVKSVPRTKKYGTLTISLFVWIYIWGLRNINTFARICFHGCQICIDPFVEEEEITPKLPKLHKSSKYLNITVLLLPK